MSRVLVAILVSSLAGPLVAAQSKPVAPPAPAWPALFSSKTLPAIDTTDWREDVAESGKIVARLRSPASWRLRRGSNGESIIAVESHDSVETVAIQPPMPLPMPVSLPLSGAPLQKYIDDMQRSAVRTGGKSLGIGQGQAGTRWWVWQELDMPANYFESVAKGRDMSGFSGMRMWTLTTMVNADVITIVAMRSMQSGMTTEMADEELRKSGQIFHQIISRITLESR